MSPAPLFYELNKQMLCDRARNTKWGCSWGWVKGNNTLHHRHHCLPEPNDLSCVRIKQVFTHCPVMLKRRHRKARVFLICMCWVIKGKKTTEGVSTRSVCLSFPSGCSSPSWHLLLLSQSGTADSVGTTQSRQRRKAPEQSADTTPAGNWLTAR